VFESLTDLVAEYEDVVQQLYDPAVIGDPRKLRDVSRRHHELEPVVDAYRAYRDTNTDLELAHEMLASAEGEDRELLAEEIEAAERRLAGLEDELKVLLLPRDPNDGRNVIVEIRGAEGGEEANLFARDLYEMYLRYAERTGLKVEVLSSDPSPMGGFNEVMLTVKGPDAWARLKHEGGPHRVQRVPVTESQGRVHTSSATVTVLPEAQEL
jgi:peptide chain release factor 1